MPDKRSERRYLEALRRALPELPTGSVTEPEPPDFLIRSADGCVGIELTVFHLPPPLGEKPHQEQQSLKDRIVAHAHVLHQSAGGPALYVSVHFRARHRLSKRLIDPLAHAIAEAVLAIDLAGSATAQVEVPWHRLPSQVVSIVAHPSINGRDQLWHADAGGWVASVQPGEVAAVIRNKAKNVRNLRACCDQLWLVIVNDRFSRAAQAELSPEAAASAYVHPFDTVIWLVPHIPSAIRLN